MKPRRLAALCLLLCTGALAFPQGAPPGTCDTMMPHHHGFQPQNSLPPYEFYLVKGGAGSGRMHLFVGSQTGEAYAGFLIMARDLATGEILGEFLDANHNASRHMNCSSGFRNGVTQIIPGRYHNLEFDWEAPSGYEGDIKFNATILKDIHTFWVGVESPRVTVSKRSIEIHSTPSPPQSRPLPTTPPYFTPTPDGLDTRADDPIYEGCGTNKICFGSADNCVDSKSCDSLVTVLVEGERYTFEMLTRVGKYVAVGLSEDSKMGDDSVVECVNNDNGEVSIHMSWNNDRSKWGSDPKNYRHKTPKDALTSTSGESVDGVIKCKFTRSKNTTVEGRSFDLVNKPYHLLLAVGSSTKDNNVGYHDVTFVASGEPKLLSDVSALGSSSDLLIRLHGALMLASWLGTASVGMLLARYYRQTWVNSQLCGKDQWFAWHRLFMLLTWVMTIAAFILIFIELGEWSGAVYHASFGLATVVLCFIQPFMAAMRPHPGASKRALFNWAHWFVGNAAHICGIIALFFASGLAKAKLPEWVDWVLVAYVAFHVFTHFFLTFAGCASDKHGSQRVNSFPMKDVHARNSMTHPDARRDAPHSGLRKATFLIYFLVVAALVAALVIMIVFAPIEDSWNSWLKMKTF